MQLQGFVRCKGASAWIVRCVVAGSRRRAVRRETRGGTHEDVGHSPARAPFAFVLSDSDAFCTDSRGKGCTIVRSVNPSSWAQPKALASRPASNPGQRETRRVKGRLAGSRERKNAAQRGFPSQSAKRKREPFERGPLECVYFQARAVLVALDARLLRSGQRPARPSSLEWNMGVFCARVVLRTGVYRGR